MGAAVIVDNTLASKQAALAWVMRVSSLIYHYVIIIDHNMSKGGSMASQKSGKLVFNLYKEPLDH